MELHVDDLIDLRNRRLTYLDRWCGRSAAGAS
jgi:hypothetical protein